MDKSVIVHKNLYEYDIKSCFYNLLKSVNHPDIIKISMDDKDSINRSIGMLQKNNPILANWLNDVSKNIINRYIKINNLKDDNIILRNKDGIITNVKLKNINNGIELSYRGFISRFMIGRNGNFLLLYNDGDMRLMGKKSYLDMSFYKTLVSTAFLSGKSYVNRIHELRNLVLFDMTQSVEKYALYDKKNEVCILKLKSGDIINVRLSFLEKIMLKDIDRKSVWMDICNFVEF